MEIIIVIGIIAWIACTIGASKESVKPSDTKKGPSFWDNLIYYALVVMFIVFMIMCVAALGPIIFVLILLIWVLKKF